MKKYSGQAIAIIMVVLVVAAVIGASLYSRMVRNKGEVVDTRESQKALEQAGNVLDAFTTLDLPSLQNLLSEKLRENDGEIVLDSIDGIKLFLEELGSDQMDLGLLGLGGGDSCSEPVVTITYAQASDGIEYGVGDVMAINVDGVDIPDGCVATLTFDPAGSGDHLFTTKYVYTEDDGSVQPYELNDMELYCLNSSGSDNCGNGTVAPTESIKQKLGKGNSITLNFAEHSNLYEFRILPLKEKIKIGLKGSTECVHILDNYSIKSTVTCTGQERTMQVVIPNAMNMGYPSLFDYTIYNSQGTLTPYHPEL